jgi:phospholipase C
VNYLQSLAHPINPNCEAGHYYLLNNYNPGYFGNGNNAFTDTNANNTVFTIPPSSVPSIGDSLIAANISWKYYGDQWNNYVPDPYQLNYGAWAPTATSTATFATRSSTTLPSWPTPLSARRTFRTLANLYSDIQNGTLPAVSFVKPSGLVDGHPSSSKLDLFEGFTQKIVDAVQANPLCGARRRS